MRLKDKRANMFTRIERFGLTHLLGVRKPMTFGDVVGADGMLTLCSRGSAKAVI